MGMINKTTPSSPGYAKEGTVPYRTQGSQLQLSAVSAGQWLDLSLMTKEGDKVTLSADAKASALHTDFEAMQVGDGDDIYAQWGELSLEQHERDITLTVEGDLNPAERREIHKVLQTINKMMNDFVQGKLAPLMAIAGGLQGLGTIDSLQVSMTFEQQVVAAQQCRTTLAYAPTGEVSRALEPSGDGIELPLKAESESLAANMARMVAGSHGPGDPLRQMADELLKACRNRIGQRHPFGGRVLNHIRNLFQNALKTH